MQLLNISSQKTVASIISMVLHYNITLCNITSLPSSQHKQAERATLSRSVFPTWITKNSKEGGIKDKFDSECSFKLRGGWYQFVPWVRYGLFQYK